MNSGSASFQAVNPSVVRKRKPIKQPELKLDKVDMLKAFSPPLGALLCSQGLHRETLA